MIRSLLLAALTVATFAAGVPATAQDHGRLERSEQFGERSDRNEGRRWRPDRRPPSYHPSLNGRDRRYYGRHERDRYTRNGRYYGNRHRRHGGWRYR